MSGMKPLSEKLEEFVESQDFFEVAYVYRHAPEIDQVEVVRRFEELKAHIKEELQAWLREADNTVHESALSSGLSSGARLWIRLQLLGTLGTTQEGK